MTEPDPTWEVVEETFDEEHAATMATLLCVGNGRVMTRGTLEEGHVGDLPGTFVAGLYDAHDVAVTNLVNAPDVFDVRVTVDGTRLGMQSCEVVEHERRLDLRTGVLHRRTVLRDAGGAMTRLESWRWASLADRSLLAMRLEVTPLGTQRTAAVTVEHVLDGHRRNLDLAPEYPPDAAFGPQTVWDKWTRARHLEHVGTEEIGDVLALMSRTIERGVRLVTAAEASVTGPSAQRRSVVHGYEHVEERLEWEVTGGETIGIDRFVAVATSRAGADPRQTCLEALERAGTLGYDAARADTEAAWARAWEVCDVVVDGAPDLTHAVRFGIHHLIAAADPEDPTVNIGAKSLSGEGYKGHVFWDTEVMMLPFFLHTLPDTARTLLRYRHQLLPGAREVAAAGGHAGARYPWESADRGTEECPRTTPDGKHTFWMREEELHVSADVVYAMLNYVDLTGDEDFLVDVVAEVAFETSRFWASRAERVDGGYSLVRVMGPDEFHSHVDDNAFTNELARWQLRRSADLADHLSASRPQEYAALARRLDLAADEPATWREVAEGLRPPRIVDDVVEQFTGYFDRLDVPITEWDDNDMPRYPEGYHHFNCEETMLLKQPDVLMLVLMLPDLLTPDQAAASFDFYERRTLHKSSLSPAIHAIVGLRVGDPSRAVRYLHRSAFVDVHDNQGNTRDGIHIASAGGTWQALVFGFAGFRVADGVLTLSPWLPQEWEALRFSVAHQDARLAVVARRDQVELTLHGPPGSRRSVRVWDVEREIGVGEPVVVLRDS
ncbi:glycoside hydrolase family 65 protein [Serinicoccus kebangsaanensis]|uniref:glycoside hydrolase family 65 protein n=1 Tax=Serinicoccus kebangsaanensis TaxID=2602069 RepID=UPI00124D5718|nr:glycosyl hydrolase family 65 protein [Serinicoccus kebangsaanensis]